MEHAQKHTPGPWIYFEQRHHGSAWNPPDDTYGCVKSAPRGYKDGFVIVNGCAPGGRSAEQKANARLIAASPELLEALEAMTQAFARHPGNADERHHAMTISRAAIAQATARQPPRPRLAGRGRSGCYSNPKGWYEMNKLPHIESYGNYASSNYGAHSLVVSIGTLRVYFSYKTPVAFGTPGRTIIRENEWGPTTGKHLNQIDGGDKKNRVSGAEFERLLAEELQAREPATATA